MKFKCTNNDGMEGILTQGKTYLGSLVNDDHARVTADDGYVTEFFIWRFDIIE